MRACSVRSDGRYGMITTTTRCPQCGADLPPDWDAGFLEQDRRFFEKHPHATRYRRPAFPGEHPFDAACSGRIMVVEVVALDDGVRARFGCEVTVPADVGVQ